MKSLQKLIQWSSTFSNIPWRKDRSLYHTLVSEVMLQQTTVATVSERFKLFISIFPTINSLAKSTENQVLLQWKGLGYYQRAKNLHKAAIIISQNFQGEIPIAIDQLQKIPGIGPYTAAAICAIGANQPYLCIDANLERIIARLYALHYPKGSLLKKEIASLFEKKIILQDIQALGPRKLNEAFMDLGREICRSKNPRCHLCHLSQECLAHAQRNPEKYPFPLKKKNASLNICLSRFVVWENNYLICYKKNDKEWLSDQFEIPTFISKSDDKKLIQYPMLNAKIKPDLSFKSAITKYKITNDVFYLSLDNWRDLCAQYNIDIQRYRPVLIHKDLNLSTSSLKALQAKEISITICWRQHQGQIQITLQPRIEKGPLQNLLEFPGGKIEKGETPLSAAIREFKEEVPCKLSSQVRWSPFGDYIHHYSDRTVKLHTFLMHDKAIQIDDSYWHFLDKEYNNIPKANHIIMKDLKQHFQLNQSTANSRQS